MGATFLAKVTCMMPLGTTSIMFAKRKALHPFSGNEEG